MDVLYVFYAFIRLYSHYFDIMVLVYVLVLVFRGTPWFELSCLCTVESYIVPLCYFRERINARHDVAAVEQQLCSSRRLVLPYSPTSESNPNHNSRDVHFTRERPCGPFVAKTVREESIRTYPR